MVFIFIAAPAWAAPLDSNQGKESSINISPKSMNLLRSGTGYIADAGNSSLYIECETSAYYPVDIIGLEINLQRWNGNSWTTIQTFNYTNLNSDEIRKTLGAPALSGYSYRLVTKHFCQDGINYEYIYTTTKGITVY